MDAGRELDVVNPNDGGDVSRFIDDKRSIPKVNGSLGLWSERETEDERHYCKYCCKDVPTFRLAEGRIGCETPVQVLRCCWECGSGLAILANDEQEAT